MNLTHEVDAGEVTQRFSIDTNALLEYRHDAVVRRYCVERGATEEEGIEVFQELKKLLALVVLDPDVEYSPSEAQDAMWHEFIMYTRDYMEFCEKYLGRYVHHVPCENGGRVTNGCEAKRRAFEVFGGIRPQWWPTRETTMRCCGMC